MKIHKIEQEYIHTLARASEHTRANTQFFNDLHDHFYF